MKTQTITRSLLAILAMALLGSCAQVAFRTTQWSVDRMEKKSQKPIRQQAAEYERDLARRYPDAGDGDILRVRVHGGRIEIGPHVSYDPVEFHIARGETRMIRFYERGHSYNIAVEVSLDRTGSTLIFDGRSNQPLKIPVGKGRAAVTRRVAAHQNDNTNPRGIVFDLESVDVQ